MLRGAGGVRIQRCISGGQQQDISLAQRNVQSLRDAYQGWPAWNAAAAFDRADLALGDAGVDRNVELAAAAGTSPLFEQDAQLVFLGSLRIQVGFQA
jgi:hypothetical protein